MSSALQIGIELNRPGFHLAVNTQLTAQGITFLFGPSGSGKTTLLRALAGLDRYTDCRIQFGQTLWQSADYFMPAHCRPIGFIFQEPSLFPHLSVCKNLAYGWSRLPKSHRKISLEDAIHWLGLEPLLNRFSAQLSGGQKQRVAIARALLTSPELLLMDEPLASLDAQSKGEILPYLEQVHARLNTPIIYVSHALDELTRLADEVLLLENGKVLAQGPVNELLTNPNTPLAQMDEACAVITGIVAGHDAQFHLTQVNVEGGSISLAQRDLNVGDAVRVRIAARDVSIALTPPTQSSITNVLPAKITHIQNTTEPSQILLQLDLGGHYILARITRRSLVQLQLTPGQSVFAQVKSASLTR